MPRSKYAAGSPYPTAKDELRDRMEGEEPAGTGDGIVARQILSFSEIATGRRFPPPQSNDASEMNADIECNESAQTTGCETAIGYVHENATAAAENRR